MCGRDWSSDVCSSDLSPLPLPLPLLLLLPQPPSLPPSLPPSFSHQSLSYLFLVSLSHLYLPSSIIYICANFFSPYLFIFSIEYSYLTSSHIYPTIMYSLNPFPTFSLYFHLIAVLPSSVCPILISDNNYIHWFSHQLLPPCPEKVLSLKPSLKVTMKRASQISSWNSC